MANFAPMREMALLVIKRGLAGFVPGFILAELAFVFFGYMHGHGDLNSDDLAQQFRAHRYALNIGYGVALIAIVAGSIWVPRFLGIFTIVFGLICAIPFWWNPLTHSWMPLATAYVNGGYHPEKVMFLAGHTVIALLVAALVQGVLAFTHPRHTIHTEATSTRSQDHAVL